MWQQWLNLILGLWVIAVPFLGFTSTGLAWTLVTTGIVVAGLALWGALYEQSDAHKQELRHATQ